MSKTFKVGEKAIVLNSRHFKEVIGRIVTITEPLQLLRNTKGDSWFGYPTNYERDGSRFCPRPHHLKKISDDHGPVVEDFAALSTWDKVGWAPTKQLERET